MGPDTCNLAAVHIPMAAFEIAMAYNVLNNPAGVHGGLEPLLADHMFHPYMNVGTAHMTNSACLQASHPLSNRVAHEACL